jgi:type IV pilus assembly protein PilO
MRFGIREIIFLIVLLAVPVASFVYVFKPRNEQITSAKVEVEEKESRLNQLREMTAKLEDIGREIERGRESIEVIEAKLPSQQDVEVVLEQVWQLAKANSLAVRSVKSEKMVDSATYRELPLRMILEGSFDGFYEFLLELENISRITRVHSMKLVRLTGTQTPTGENASPGTMRAEFTLSIYFEDSNATETAQRPARNGLDHDEPKRHSLL